MTDGTQPDLWDVGPEDRALARNTDPGTSHEAAAEMSDARISTLQRTALEALASLGGEGTNDDVVAASGVDWNTITPRMRPLSNKGMVAEVGKRKSPRTNRQQIVWRVTERGRRALLEGAD